MEKILKNKNNIKFSEKISFSLKLYSLCQTIRHKKKHNAKQNHKKLNWAFYISFIHN